MNHTNLIAHITGVLTSVVTLKLQDEIFNKPDRLMALEEAEAGLKFIIRDIKGLVEKSNAELYGKPVITKESELLERIAVIDSISQIQDKKQDDWREMSAAAVDIVVYSSSKK